MREIRLRAWDTKTKNWVEDITLHMSDHLIHLPLHILLTQSTGLKDKHGREIYAGDILLFCWPSGKGQNIYSAHIGSVAEDIDDYGATFEYTGVYFLEKDSRKPTAGYWPSVDQLEIIGNIYETPELVESH